MVYRRAKKKTLINVYMTFEIVFVLLSLLGMVAALVADKMRIGAHRRRVPGRSNRKATVASSRWTYLAQNLLRNRQRFAKNTLRNKFYTVHPTEADAIFQGASHAQRGCSHKRGRPAL